MYKNEYKSILIVIFHINIQIKRLHELHHVCITENSNKSIFKHMSIYLTVIDNNSYNIL